MLTILYKFKYIILINCDLFYCLLPIFFPLLTDNINSLFCDSGINIICSQMKTLKMTLSSDYLAYDFYDKKIRMWLILFLPPQHIINDERYYRQSTMKCIFTLLNLFNYFSSPERHQIWGKCKRKLFNINIFTRVNNSTQFRQIKYNEPSSPQRK